MVSSEIEEGQIVLCTVINISGTTVFVKLDDYGDEGTITTSEIAPGRIRNLREYVIPGKKIVCQILSIKEGRIQLSLRRVKQQDRKELLEKLDKEKSYMAILKTVLGKEDSENTKNKICEDFSLFEFFEKIRTDTNILEKYVTKENAEKIYKILESKKEKQKENRQIFTLSNKSTSGINTVKEIIQNSCKGTKCSITYISAGKYAMSQKGDDFKAIKNEMNSAITNIEKEAKKKGCEFSVEKS